MKTIRYEFRNIPKASNFAAYDRKCSKTHKKVWEIPVGDTDIQYDLPDDWIEPYQQLRSKSYWIPNINLPITAQMSVVRITGGNYYIDISRVKIPEELNQESIESLIGSAHVTPGLSERQQFFIALVSLQSYFEYLVYGMLVLSGYKSTSAFDRLGNHKKRIHVAFSANNTHFFSNTIEICSGKSGLGHIITSAERTKIQDIFDAIRIMRNKVVHSWGYKDIPKEDLNDFFDQLGEPIDTRTSEGEFYKRAAFTCVRLYAKVNYIKTQLSYFHEKEMIRLERQNRGY